MKNLVMTALALGGAASMAACTTEEDPAGGEILVSWSLANDTAPASCPAGAVAVVNDGSVGEPIDCATGSMLLLEDPGTYTVWVDIEDASGAVLARSFSQTISVVEGGSHPADFDIQLNYGYLDFAWTLHGETSGDLLTCADVVGEDGVSIDITMVGSSGALAPDVFDCEDAGGTTYPVEIGLYTADISIIDAGNPPLALGAAASVTDVNVTYGNELVDLGTVDIEVFGL